MASGQGRSTKGGIGAGLLRTTHGMVDIPPPSVTSWQQYGALLLFDASQWGTVEVYFEAIFKGNIVSQTVAARLWDITNGAEITQLTTDSLSYNRWRSAVITLSGSAEYRCEIGANTPGTISIRGARIVVVGA